MKIIVLHNTGDGMFWEYQPDKAVLSHAHTFQVPDRLIPAVVTKVAEWVWDICNMDYDYAEHTFDGPNVLEYRERQNRSLSVGDVVVLMQGEAPIIALACQRIGWDPIELDLSTIDLTDVDNHLSVSLARQAHEAIGRGDSPVPNPLG